MTAFTTLLNALFLPGKRILGSSGMALRDNLLSAMEGDPTAVAAGVTLKDPALDTGVATAAGTTWVGLRTAGLALDAIGSYAMLRDSDSAAGGPYTRSSGATIAGAALQFSSASGEASGSPSGTWRLMGRTQYGAALALVSPTRVSLWLRIS